MNKQLSIFPLILFIFIFTAQAQAQVLEYNIYDFEIKYGSVIAVNQMVFMDKVNISSNIAIPKDAKGILLSINNENIEPLVIEDDKNKFLAINSKNVDRIRISYITEELIDKNEFLANIGANYAINLLQASLTLQPGTALEKPIKKGYQPSPSIYPKPDKIDVDGQSLIFIWERSKLRIGDELSIFVRFKQKASLLWIIIPTALFSLILIFYVYYLRQHKQNSQKAVIKKESGKK